jgi:hypothetical protein
LSHAQSPFAPAAHCELDLSACQLPPMLNNRHMAALRELVEDFVSLLFREKSLHKAAWQKQK